ncbi:MAG TPA: hypothetical protein VGK74_27625 [Symbiobacteriaceae bacterium]
MIDLGGRRGDRRQRRTRLWSAILGGFLVLVMVAGLLQSVISVR